MSYKTKLVTFSLILALYCGSTIAQKFNVRYIAPSQANFSGNVFLYLSKDNKNPKDGDVGIESFPCYRMAINNIKTNQSVLFDDAAVSFPVPLSDLERGEYYVQAVWDKNSGGRAISNTPGNMFDKPVRVTITKERNHVFNVVCDKVVPEPAFEETEYSKEIKGSPNFYLHFIADLLP